MGRNTAAGRLQEQDMRSRELIPTGLERELGSIKEDAKVKFRKGRLRK